MAKKSIQFVCTNCAAFYAAWAGKCATCGEWNTLVEKTDSTPSSGGKTLQVAQISSVAKHDSLNRLSTSMPDVDQVLGGGLVVGGVVLLAGEPGIGKSTLLMQVASGVSGAGKVLYISGEESAHQVGMRAVRLGVSTNNIDVATSNSTNDIIKTIQDGSYAVVIIDSVQTIRLEEVVSAPGSVSQITNSTYLLAHAAKQVGSALILVGHVTKEGSIAGPKVLEHTVDVVLQLEGDRYGGFKMLRTIKNRYGSTGETGIFEMSEKGLFPVDNPSAVLLSERQAADGSVVFAHMEGSRSLLVEIQSLVTPTAFGYPKRAASGFDLNRLNLLLAMIERRTKLQVADKDVYINVVGGIKLNEPAADLAVVMAVASAAKGMQLKKNAAVCGELGLSGEVRHVPFMDARVSEALKLGFDGIICPGYGAGNKPKRGLLPVKDVRSALNTYLEKE